ncbi:MAG: site-2 protease family protein [Rhodothalassiaceae bacterium]
MFGRNVTLFHLFGFAIRVNISWAFLAILIALSLARGFFPAVYEGWPESTYWWMAAVGVIGVFFSIVIHELSHSLAARAFGLRMTGITLFLFGGMAEMEKEPTSPRAELVMALAGPAISFVLAALFWGLGGWAEAGEEATPSSAVLYYLGLLNLILAVFNMIPAFPMDGGRALRAGLWAWRGNYRWATKWASRLGGAFGLVLILLGILSAFSGALVQGLWWFLIGMFIRAAAQSAYQQMEVRRLMGGVTAGDLMRPDPHAVHPDIPVRELVEHYVYEFQQTQFPVVLDGELIGIVGMDKLRELPKERWDTTSVREILTPTDQADLVDPGEDAVDAIRMLQQKGLDGLVVAKGRRALGLLSKADVIKLLNLKMDLEQA